MLEHSYQAARNQKKYAIFQATVIASIQEPSYPEKAKEKLTYVPVIEKISKQIIHTNEELPPPDQKDLNLC